MCAFALTLIDVKGVSGFLKGEVSLLQMVVLNESLDIGSLAFLEAGLRVPHS